MPLNFHTAAHPQPVENSVVIIFLQKTKDQKAEGAWSGLTQQRHEWPHVSPHS